jgi:hypothetical protein
MDDRATLARVTRRGIGATIAGIFFWAAAVALTTWSGLPVRTQGWALLCVAILVYPAGYLINRALGGDLLARGHPLGGIVRTLGATEGLGWAVTGVFVLQAPTLVPFAMAAMAGAHFLPFAWLYRSRAYAVLGAASVTGAALLQILLPDLAPRAIPASMVVGYALATIAVARQNGAEAPARVAPPVRARSSAPTA